MKQIILQKKYLFLVEVDLNVYRVFVIIVNFVINILENGTKKVSFSIAQAFEITKYICDNTKKLIKKAFKYLTKIVLKFYQILSLIFNYFIKDIKEKIDPFSRKINFKKIEFLIYSNLLSPPFYKKIFNLNY